MCNEKEHVFFTIGLRRPTVGEHCICGRHRWGTEAELQALDEVAALERAFSLPAKEPRV